MDEGKFAHESWKGDLECLGVLCYTAKGQQHDAEDTAVETENMKGRSNEGYAIKEKGV